MPPFPAPRIDFEVRRSEFGRGPRPVLVEQGQSSPEVVQLERLGHEVHIRGIGVGFGPRPLLPFPRRVAFRSKPLPEDPGQAERADDVDYHDERGEDGFAAAPPPDLLGWPHGAGLDGFIAEKPAQLLGKRPGRGVTPCRVLLEAFEAEGFQVARDAGVQ